MGGWVAKKSRKFKLNKQNIESRAPKSTFNTKRRRSTTTTDWTLTLKWHPERTEQMAAEVKVFFGIFWTFPVSSTRDYNWTTLLETTLVYNERTLLWYGSTFALKIVTLGRSIYSNGIPCLVVILMHSSKCTFRNSLLDQWTAPAGRKEMLAKNCNLLFRSIQLTLLLQDLAVSCTNTRSVGWLVAWSLVLVSVYCTRSHNTIIPYLLSI